METADLFGLELELRQRGRQGHLDVALLERHQGRFLDIYTEHGGTKTETEKLMAQFKQRGTACFAGKESDAKPADLQTNKLVFLYSDLPHDEVVHKRQEFREFLKTSCLGKGE